MAAKFRDALVVQWNDFTGMSHAIELSAIAACVGDQWSPQIGDPTIAGWATVVAYALCAVLSFMALLRVEDRRERIFWGLVTLAMLTLGVNKQLDLQSVLTAAGRCLSQLQGWYEERRVFQRDFIIGLLMAAGLFLTFVLWLCVDTCGGTVWHYLVLASSPRLSRSGLSDFTISMS